MLATRSRTNTDIVTLDGDTPIIPVYLAEGAANIVFMFTSEKSIRIRDDEFGQPGTTTIYGTPRIDYRLKGKLLRLRKALPSTAPVIESHRHFEEQIEPLFPAECLVEQSLCKVTPDFVKNLNKDLRRLEGRGGRPEKRRMIYLAEDEPYATLITDMRWDDEHVSCEFKPKWLTQSPSAPPGSKRCRTCALRAMRQVKEFRKPDYTDVCPLTLFTKDQDILSSSLRSILGATRGAPMYSNLNLQRLRPYIRGNPLIERLRDLQVQKDPQGILKADPSSLDFLTAMALRDCTMFLKIPKGYETKAQMEARLGDLDLKTPDGNKAAYWRETEQQLIDEGWYTATEKTPPDEEKYVSNYLGRPNWVPSLVIRAHPPIFGGQMLELSFEDMCIVLCILSPFPSFLAPYPLPFAACSLAAVGILQLPSCLDYCFEVLQANSSLIMSTSDYVHWVLDAVCNAHNVLALINGQSRRYGSTYIDQYIPTLCYGVEYNLTYSFQVTISGGQPGMTRSVSYSLASIGELAHIGPPSGDQRPFSYQKSSYNRRTVNTPAGTGRW
ncbi:MAG: hypothetical protein LQ338_001857 [Usnochroma carphineum]|nr:MAG: hypothetical protein LQ338_001857 [Usnochroma carphineum]